MSEETARLSPNHLTSPTRKIDRMPTVIKGRPPRHTSSKNLLGLQKDDLVNLLCVLEAEVQARDMIINAITKGEIGSSLPLSHLLGDGQLANVVKIQEIPTNDEDEEVWLGEPTAHLNHVVAYHQLVREQMQAMLQDQHKTILRQLEDERQIHAIDTAQGDQVTYMLEKDRERLTNEIEFQQTKLSKAEKERDQLFHTLEKEREEKQIDFNLLLNDCKMFAKQLIEQAQKEEQLLKEIEQEKRKNRVLSELMVEEQKRFKEKLKRVDDDRTGSEALEQQRSVLEERLIDSEKRAIDAHQKYIQESQLVEKLRSEVKQLKLVNISEDSFESAENSDELVYNEQIAPPALGGVRAAKIVQPNKIVHDDKDRTVASEEKFSTLPVVAPQKVGIKTASHLTLTTAAMSPIKTARNVAQPVNLKQNGQTATMRLARGTSHSPSSSPILQHSPKHSPKPQHSPKHSPKPQHSPKHSPKPQHSPKHSPKLQHSPKHSPQHSPNLQHSPKHLSNFTHGTVEDTAKNRKIPPPTPPRVSSITAKSVPVLLTDADANFESLQNNDGGMVRSHSVGASSAAALSVPTMGTFERRQTMSGAVGSTARSTRKVGKTNISSV